MTNKNVTTFLITRHNNKGSVHGLLEKSEALLALLLRTVSRQSETSLLPVKTFTIKFLTDKRKTVIRFPKFFYNFDVTLHNSL